MIYLRVNKYFIHQLRNTRRSSQLSAVLPNSPYYSRIKQLLLPLLSPTGKLVNIKISTNPVYRTKRFFIIEYFKEIASFYCLPTTYLLGLWRRYNVSFITHCRCYYYKLKKGVYFFNVKVLLNKLCGTNSNTPPVTMWGQDASVRLKRQDEVGRGSRLTEEPHLPRTLWEPKPVNARKLKSASFGHKNKYN